MSKKTAFITAIVDGYNSKGESILLGSAILDIAVVTKLKVIVLFVSLLVL